MLVNNRKSAVSVHLNTTEWSMVLLYLLDIRCIIQISINYIHIRIKLNTSRITWQTTNPSSWQLIYWSLASRYIAVYTVLFGTQEWWSYNWISEHIIHWSEYSKAVMTEIFNLKLIALSLCYSFCYTLVSQTNTRRYVALHLGCVSYCNRDSVNNTLLTNACKP